MMTFRSLIDERYLRIGFSRKQVFCEVYRLKGVSTSSLDAAYRGTRIDADNAEKLREWAREIHHIELDVLQLLTAPVRRRAV